MENKDDFNQGDKELSMDFKNEKLALCSREWEGSECGMSQLNWGGVYHNRV